MAKASLTKLGLKVNQEIKTIEFNGQVIEVKQYLPVNNKLELISNVINMSADGNNFANPLKVEVYFALEVIEAYTNISFKKKQKEDIPTNTTICPHTAPSSIYYEKITKYFYVVYHKKPIHCNKNSLPPLFYAHKL